MLTGSLAPPFRVAKKSGLLDFFVGYGELIAAYQYTSSPTFLSRATPRKMEHQEEDPFLAGWASWMDQALPADGAVPDTWSDVELSPELQAQEARLEALRAAPVPAIIRAARDGDVNALLRELDLGVSVDLADAWKSTPLQVACGAKDVSAEDRFACAKLLVSRGACLQPTTIMQQMSLRITPGIARTPTCGKSRPRAAGKPTKKRTAQNSSRPSCRNLRTSFRKSSCR